MAIGGKIIGMKFDKDGNIIRPKPKIKTTKDAIHLFLAEERGEKI
jgi:hypothetical protein